MDIVDSQLVIVMELADCNLADRFRDCRAQKLPGIPRIELLEYLHTVAEGLDYVYQQHLVHHLGLNPRNVLLDDDEGVQIAEFGLAHLFWLPAGQPVAQRNARYAPPELFEGQVHRNSDQYSLALMYQELLIGSHAFTGQGRPGAKAARKPDLTSLPETDREIIARALEADPQKRWPSCLDLIRALEEATTPDQRPPSHQDSDFFTDVLAAGAAHRGRLRAGSRLADHRRVDRAGTR